MESEGLVQMCRICLNRDGAHRALDVLQVGILGHEATVARHCIKREEEREQGPHCVALRHLNFWEVLATCLLKALVADRSGEVNSDGAPDQWASHQPR